MTCKDKVAFWDRSVQCSTQPGPDNNTVFSSLPNSRIDCCLQCRLLDLDFRQVLPQHQTLALVALAQAQLQPQLHCLVQPLQHSGKHDIHLLRLLSPIMQSGPVRRVPTMCNAVLETCKRQLPHYNVLMPYYVFILFCASIKAIHTLMLCSHIRFAFEITTRSRFGQQQSQPSLFGSSQQQQSQQQQNQLTIFGASSQQQQQQQPSSFVGSFPLQPQQQQQQQQPQGPLSAYAAAQMAPASQEIVAIAQAFSKDSDQYPFRHLFLNVVDDPRRYGRPRGTSMCAPVK